jgi:hypothetical protein
MFFKKLSFFGNKDEAPGFFKRGLALCIDLILILMITTPVSTILIKTMYKNELPLAVIYKAVPQEFEESDTLSTVTKKMLNDPHVKEYFAKENVFIKTLIDQLSQLAILITYFLFFWHKFQATPGKLLFKLRIVDQQTLEKPTFYQLVKRIIGFIISLPIFGIGFMLCIFNRDKRCLHDFMAKTKVIHKI